MIVVFDIAEFRTFYPKIGPEAVTDSELEYFFSLAETFIANTDASRFPYDPDNRVFVRKQLLYLMVCHLATMAMWDAGQSGPVTSAAQGSVSVGFQNVQMGNQQWYSQTPCGRTLLQMLKPYALGGRIFTKPDFHPYG